MPWELTGNANTDPTVNFVGTTDQEGLSLRTHGTEAVRIDPSGNVGVGTSNPTSKLEIHAQDGVQIIGYQPFLTLSDSNSGYQRARIQTANGEIGFLTEPSAGTLSTAMTIQPSGDVTMNGNLTVAQDIKLTGGDCAEDFDLADLKCADPGTVMITSEEGSLEPSRHAYDRRAAGVVSGAGEHKPGIILNKQQSETDRVPIALVGRVCCKVDARHSPIAVGDLLTTSTTPGHAMKAEDPLKAFGSVIGKALRPLHEGLGLIPILIALQ